MHSAAQLYWYAELYAAGIHAKIRQVPLRRQCCAGGIAAGGIAALNDTETLLQLKTLWVFKVPSLATWFVMPKRHALHALACKQ